MTVNGRVVRETTQLEHNDRIRFGIHNYWLIVIGGSGPNPKINWEYAYSEATKNIVEKYMETSTQEDEEVKENQEKLRTIEKVRQREEKEVEEEIKKMEEEQKGREEELMKELEKEMTGTELKKEELREMLKQSLEREKREFKREMA